MLSILIPLYNINCTPLVDSLIQQIDKLDANIEIICIDDASTTLHTAHSKYKEKDYLNYFQLTENLGRSRIRNLLASKASYDWLLFMDADTLPTHDKYLSDYIDIIKRKAKVKVVSGGLSYRESDLNDSNHLRYKYGKARESIAASIRMKTPYTSLLMSNALVHKSVFNKVQFNNQITSYGHEDAVFSYDLYTASILVEHVDNPIFHTGIEDNCVFLKKSKIAIENLWELYNKGVIKPEINRLLKWLIRLNKWGILNLFSGIYAKKSKSIEKRLCKKNPSLLLFDLYRLCYLCSVSRTKK